MSTGILNAFTGVVGGYVKYNAQYDNGLVHFSSSDTTSWMLKTQWAVGQVKRVYRDDANVSGTGYGVDVPVDANGNTREVSFRKGSYVEFMCVDFCNIGGTDFAVLLNNGYRY